VRPDALIDVPATASHAWFAATPIAADAPAQDRAADACVQAAPGASVVARIASFTRSGFARTVRIGRWAYAGMKEDASGLQSLAGSVVSLSMLAGYVLLLKLLAPGVLEWIRHHSLGNGQVWLIEILFAGLIPFAVCAVVVDGLRRLARKGARHRPGRDETPALRKDLP
jgi:hypothetical protein